ncbi:hypothetical protein D3C73_1628590 [compost metagenome]
MSCSTMTTVLPRSSASFRSTFIICTECFISRLFSGSSSRMYSVFCATVIAMKARWFWPPLS